MRTYGQYCPIARAAEILAERWTPLIVRDLLSGCQTYSELMANAPGIPRSLLTERLRKLERAGVVERRAAGRRNSYHLTDRGRDLAEVCQALGTWGARWLETRDEHRDAHLALVFWSQSVDRAALPADRVVLRFDLTDGSRPDRFWVLLSQAETEVCVQHPGYDEDLVVATDTKWLIDWHSGAVSLAAAKRAGGMTFSGSRSLVRAFESWGGLSPFAGVARAG